jgi:hypothetical protein
MRIGGNEYSLREAAGGFDDLGTLIPFLVGSITVARIDPTGVLVAFGAFTANVALWNMGAAYVGGIALWYGLQRGGLRL